MEINTIHLGDAYELIKQVPDKSVDLIVTDPPYQFGDSGWGAENDGKWYSRQYAKEIADETLANGIDISILNEFVRVLNKVNIYIWCNKAQIYDYLTFFVKEKKCNFEIIVWSKTNPSPFLNGNYLKDKEYCLYFWESGAMCKPSVSTGRTVYVTNVNKADKEKYGHPTIKPESIIENLIKNSCGGG